MDERTLAAWLVERLSSDAAREDWRVFVESGVEGVLARPLGEVLPAEAFTRGLDEVLTESRLSGLARASAQVFLSRIIEQAQANDGPIGQGLSEDARSRIEEMAAREGLIDEAWVDVIFSQPATEELFAETLFRGLQDFSETIPQMVQTFTPAAFGKIASRLTGSAGGVRDRMRDEVRARFEPEIRKFVQRATRRLLDGTSGFVKSGLDREGARDARRNLMRHALNRPMSSYARHFDEAVMADLEAALVAAAQSPEVRDQARHRLVRMHGELLEKHGATPIRDVLEGYDLETRPDYDALADAMWPAARAFVRSKGVEQLMTRLSKEILELVRSS